MPIHDTNFADEFKSLDRETWYVSDFIMSEGWINTGWSPKNVETSGGVMKLTLDTRDIGGKSYTGAEVQSEDRFHYGTYEVRMKASGEEGVNSSFFTYTGPYFGHPWNEIDIEILGKDPRAVTLSYHNDGKSYSTVVDLPFDASKGFHTYAFDWHPDRISWYADGKLLHEVTSPGIPIPDHPSKIIMNIWTGMNHWLGDPDFRSATSAFYGAVEFTPYDPGVAHPGTVDVDLFVVDAANDQVIAPLTDGATITLPAGVDDIAILARPAGGSTVGSLRFALDGPSDHDATENAAPYALFGDRNGNLRGEHLAEGSYDLTVTAFSGANGTGARLFSEDIDFVLTESTADVALYLVDAATDRVITALEDGARIDSEALASRKLSIVAVTDGFAADSLVLELDGAIDHRQVENLEPYALFGDDERTGDVVGRTFRDGDYALSVTAYDERNGHGYALASFDLEFQIV